MEAFRLESKILPANRFRAALLVARPVRLPIPPELMQIPPGEQAGVMAIVKDDFHRIVSDRLHCTDPYVFLSEHQHLLSGAMPFDFRGGRVHPQVLKRQLKAAAVRKADLQQPGFAADLDFCSEGFGHMLASISRGL